MAVVSSEGPRQPLQTYEFRRKTLRKDMSIQATRPGVATDAEGPLYFVRATELRRHTPDIVLHEGADAAGRVLGVAHFRHRRHVTFGLGDPDSDAYGVVWEEMRRLSKGRLKRRFEFALTEFPGVGDQTHDLPRRRHFLWERTAEATDGVQGLRGRISLRNFRLTDKDSDQVLAVFLSSALSSFTKKGELRVFENLSPVVEVAVILTCASISELMTRD